MTHVVARPDTDSRRKDTERTSPFIRLSSLSPSDWCYLLALAGFLSQGVLNTIASTLGAVLPVVTDDWFTPVAIHVPFALYICARFIERRPLRFIPFVVVYSILLIMMLLSMVLHPEYVPTMFDETWSGSLWSTLLSPTAPVVAFLVVTLAPSGHLILLSLIVASYATFAGNVFRYGVSTLRGYWIAVDSQGNEYASAYDLGFGYSVLLSVVVFTFLALSGRRPWPHLTGAAVSLFMILTGGSRAPLGVAFLAILMLVVYFRRSVLFGSRWRVTGLLFLGAAGIVLTANLNRILVSIQSWLAARGSSARSLDRLIDGSFTDDSARDNLGLISARLIDEGGPFGLGLYGDRYHIRRQYHWGYPHNFLDEMWVTYGWLGGTLLVIVGVALAVRAYLRARHTLHAALMVVVLPLIFQLWVSMSYLLSVWFWVLLAVTWRSLTLPREELGAGVRGRPGAPEPGYG
ncbi:O-antigen ligase family protein [Micrococcus endophyticus]|uniref:O-antigen ligase family protein n=1 Tax=Micrococcus endophyticus TaxID=455343 RepID=UPI0037FC6033